MEGGPFSTLTLRFTGGCVTYSRGTNSNLFKGEGCEVVPGTVGVSHFHCSRITQGGVQKVRGYKSGVIIVAINEVAARGGPCFVISVVHRLTGDGISFHF